MLSSKRTTIPTSFPPTSLPTLFLVFLDRLPHNHLRPLDRLHYLSTINLPFSSRRIILSHLQHLVSLLLPRQIPLSTPHSPILLISLTHVRGRRRSPPLLLRISASPLLPRSPSPSSPSHSSFSLFFIPLACARKKERGERREKMILFIVYKFIIIKLK